VKDKNKYLFETCSGNHSGGGDCEKKFLQAEKVPPSHHFSLLVPLFDEATAQ